MLRAGLRVKALAHITSTGFLNLSRAAADVGYVLDTLPEPQPIFHLIQRHGNVTDEEMFFTYNMGVGYCVIVASEDAASVQQVARAHGVESHVIGYTVKDPKKEVRIPAHGLSSFEGKFCRR